MSVGIPSGNAINIEVRDITVDLASVGANTSANTSVTVNGLRTSDFVWVNAPDMTAGLALANCKVTAANTLLVEAINTTAGAIDFASGTFKLLIVRPE